MSQTLKAVRGTRDLLPPETALWNRIEGPETVWMHKAINASAPP
jgi:hypothetical protein